MVYRRERGRVGQETNEEKFELLEGRKQRGGNPAHRMEKGGRLGGEWSQG